MFVVYILQSQLNSKYYIGYTNDIDDRLKRHNNGREKSTKPARPWAIVYTETFPDKTSAMTREKQIKSYKGGNAFKKLVRL